MIRSGQRQRIFRDSGPKCKSSGRLADKIQHCLPGEKDHSGGFIDLQAGLFEDLEKFRVRVELHAGGFEKKKYFFLEQLALLAGEIEKF